jgi:GNAT superfamily N-acetyltransferase
MTADAPPDAPLDGPSLDVVGVALADILGMRDEYRREMACQIVHDSWHGRGFTRSYVLRADGRVAGYGSVGGAPRDPHDTLKEFFVRPAHRAIALPLFRHLVAASGARAVEAQTNDALLMRMLQACAVEPTSDTLLFEDGDATALGVPLRGAVVRPVTSEDHAHVFPHAHEPVGEWGVEWQGALVATGGLAFHYNPPYGDLFMEVAAPHRRRGVGSYLVQELKRRCRESGHVPAARCHADNVASRRTLERAGMRPCARVVRARLAP